MRRRDASNLGFVGVSIIYLAFHSKIMYHPAYKKPTRNPLRNIDECGPTIPIGIGCGPQVFQTYTKLRLQFITMAVVGRRWSPHLSIFRSP
jgi:hypothetical protein